MSSALRPTDHRGVFPEGQTRELTKSGSAWVSGPSRSSLDGLRDPDPPRCRPSYDIDGRMAGTPPGDHTTTPRSEPGAVLSSALRPPDCGDVCSEGQTREPAASGHVWGSRPSRSPLDGRRDPSPPRRRPSCDNGGRPAGGPPAGRTATPNSEPRTALSSALRPLDYGGAFPEGQARELTKSGSARVSGPSRSLLGGQGMRMGMRLRSSHPHET